MLRHWCNAWLPLTPITSTLLDKILRARTLFIENNTRLLFDSIPHVDTMLVQSTLLYISLHVPSKCSLHFCKWLQPHHTLPALSDLVWTSVHLLLTSRDLFFFGDGSYTHLYNCLYLLEYSYEKAHKPQEWFHTCWIVGRDCNHRYFGCSPTSSSFSSTWSSS